MAGEVSQSDRQYIQTLLNHKKEEQIYLGTITKEEKKKQETKLILVTQHRIYVLKSGEHKIQKDSHLLDLVEIKSNSPNDVHMVFKSFEVDGTTPRADDLITNIRLAYEMTFFGTPEDARFKLDIKPPARVVTLYPKELPLGGFVNTYTALCDYYGHAARDELCWDMEHTYSTKNIRTFDLNEIEQPLHANDIRALLTALKYNSHFTSLVVCDIPFQKEQIAVLADVLKSNSAIETLKLSSIGARAEAVTTLCAALSANKNIALTELDISNNLVEDKGLVPLANFLGTTSRGLVSLNISNTGLSKTGTAALGSALKKNVKMSATLAYLNISGNKLEAEGSSSMSAFFANPNSLRSLHMHATNPNLETIIGALVRGSSELRFVDLSDNKMVKKDATLLARLITASSTLKQLTLNRTAIPADALKEVLVAISGNVYLQDFVFEVKGNELGLPGAQAVASIASKMSNVHTLDLDDCELGDDGLAALAEGLCNNTYLKHLNVSRNFKPAKSKPRPAMLESISTLLSSDCPLERLVIAGGAKSQLRGDVIPLIYDLATNTSLLEIDVSGHLMGNKGAIALGKALQTNNVLTSLSWDENATTLLGFQAFKTGMERNHTLKAMPVPILDIANALKSDPQPRLQTVIGDLERALGRNQTPGGQFEAHTSTAIGSFTMLTSGQQQGIDKLVLKIKSTGHKVEDKDHQLAIQDAGSTEKFVAQLHLLREAAHQAAEDEMRARLHAFTTQASDVLAEKKRELVTQILKSLQESFQSMDRETLRRLQTGIEFGAKDLDQAELQKILVKATGAELSSRANETFLSCVEIASDYVYEKMEDRLNEIYAIMNEIDLEDRSAPSTPVTPHTPHSPPISTPVNPPSPAPVRKDKEDSPVATPAATPAAAPASPAITATPTPATPTPAGPPKPAPRTGAAAPPPRNTEPAPVATTPGKLAGNAAVAAAIARNAGPMGMPGVRPPIVRPARDSSGGISPAGAASPVMGARPAAEPEPKEEPAKPTEAPKKEDPKLEAKKEKERKEKEEKERKEREKKEKEEKERKAKADAKAKKDAVASKGKEPAKGKDAPAAVVIEAKPHDQELVHLTKDRPKVPGKARKPPTRRPRPPTSGEGKGAKREADEEHDDQHEPEKEQHKEEPKPKDEHPKEQHKEEPKPKEEHHNEQKDHKEQEPKEQKEQKEQTEPPKQKEHESEHEHKRTESK